MRSSLNKGDFNEKELAWLEKTVKKFWDQDPDVIEHKYNYPEFHFEEFEEEDDGVTKKVITAEGVVPERLDEDGSPSVFGFWIDLDSGFAYQGLSDESV